jgi:ribosome maturation factor RimP
VSAIQADIEARLAESEPDVEVLLAELVGGKLVRLFIDHPKGVTLDLCERVTKLLPDVRERYALEVSSPGPERPLSTSAATSVGARACVRAHAMKATRASPASCWAPPTTR